MRYADYVLSSLLCVAGIVPAAAVAQERRPAAAANPIRDLTHDLGADVQGPTRPRPLWPGGAPGAAGTEPADVPTIAVYAPADAAGPTAAVVVCPGGGYGFLASHEGPPVAQWLNTFGVTGVVLRYRHAPKYHHPAPLQDAQRAIRMVRARAKEWNIDPNKVGILGFSAGGHLAATASTQFDAGKADAPDPVDRQSCRPDFSILLYPVITFAGDKKHAGSQKNLLGEGAGEEMAKKMSAELNVTKDTPLAFLFHTVEDAGVPVENSVLYAMALRKAGVSFEMHLFEKGRHGVGLAENDPVLRAWPDLCAAWLRARGYGQPPAATGSGGAAKP